MIADYRTDQPSRLARVSAWALLVGTMLALISSGAFLFWDSVCTLAHWPNPLHAYRPFVYPTGVAAAFLAHNQFDRGRSFLNRMIFSDET